MKPRSELFSLEISYDMFSADEPALKRLEKAVVKKKKQWQVVERLSFLSLCWAVWNWGWVDLQNFLDETEKLGQKKPLQKGKYWSPRINKSMRIGFNIGQAIHRIKSPYKVN